MGNKALTDIVTFTRASGGSYTDSAGVLRYARNNEPRYDYNPSTLAFRGVLIEEARTNYVRNNTNIGAVAGSPGTMPTYFGTYTPLTGITRQIVGTGIENGIPYIDIRVYGTPSAAGSYLWYWEASSGIAATTAQTWTCSAYAKRVSGSLTGVSGVFFQADEYTSVPAYIRSNNGSQFTLSDALARYSHTFTTSGGATTAYILPCFTLSLSGAAVDVTVRFGAAQMEIGSFITSPILTAGVTASRSLDQLKIDGSNFTTLYNSTEGTLYAESLRTINSPSGSYYPAVFSINSDINNRMVMYTTFISSAQNYRAYGSASTVQQFDIGASPGTNVTVGTVAKTALAYSLNDFALSVNGSVPLTDTVGTLPTVSKAEIGSETSVNPFNGWIRKIKYYPKRLTNAELQALTS